MDLDRIKRNVAKMASQGAPETDIDGYIASEGATVDQVKNHKPGGWLRGLAQGAVDTVRGKQDPNYAGTPDLIGAVDTLDPASKTRVLEGSAGAKSTAISDEGYADVLQEQLGDSFIRREQDAHGYPVLIYRDAEGKEARAYANRPGLDWQDFDRGMYAAMPYLVGGGLAGTATKGMKLLPRMAAQGVMGAGVSVGQDVAASEMGSEQGIDPTRAVIAGGFGAAAEGAAPLAHWGKQALGFGTRYVDDAGKLTKDGRLAAQRAGVDPNELDAEATQAFAEALRVGRDPAEALSQVRSNRFGIPTTKGQRTKDPELLTIEKDIRFGTLGQDAKATLGKLDKDQTQAITNQVRGHVVTGRDGIDEFQGIGANIAPTRLPHEQNVGNLGQSVRSGLRQARDAVKAQEREAWEALPDMVPSGPASFDGLPGFIEGALGKMRVQPQLMPTAMKMDADLAAYRAGNATVEGGPQMINQAPIQTLGEMRRSLLESYKAAAPGSPDAKAAKAYYDGFNDWMWDAAEKGLLNVGAEDVAKMSAARQMTREIKDMLAPTRGGKKTPAAKILSDVLDNADSPERVVASLFGSSGPQTPPKEGIIGALNRMKALLNRPENHGGSMVAKETWNDIRLAYWLRLATDKNGATLSPTMLKKNIERAFQNQRSVLNVLFSDAERKEFQAFARAVGEAAYKDPNPSGTASALRAMANGPRDSLLKTGLQVQSKRELFSKHNVLMSRIYSMLAKKVPNLGGSRDFIGAKAAQRAVDQRLTPRRPLSTGQFGAAYGAQSEAD